MGTWARRTRTRWAAGAATLAGLLLVALPAGAGATGGSADWPAYLDGPGHASDNAAATGVTPADAAGLALAWNWRPDPPPGTSGLTRGIVASPVSVDGVVYVGSNNGDFYALSRASGAVLWRDAIGAVHKTTCGSRGFASTATVVPDPATGSLTVYVAGADGYLYALDAASGAVRWRSVIGIPSATKNDYFDWSSPAVANGRVYVGISSQCDSPLVRGGLLAFDQSSGAQDAAYYTVPPGRIGGSIWSSPAVAPDGTVFVTTGNGPQADNFLGTSLSVIALDGTTLTPLGSWQSRPRR
jgi:outer membrane protein assembly factor BamB